VPNKEIERSASGRLRKRGAWPPLISKTLGRPLGGTPIEERSTEPRPPLVDGSGNPLRSPEPVAVRISRLSGALWVRLVAGAVVIAAVVAFFANLGTLFDHMPAIHRPKTIPSLTVRIHNSATDTVSVYPRGEVLLWPPGQSIRYTSGTFEMTSGNGSVLAQPLPISRGETATVRVKILNPDRFGDVFAAGDWDLTLMIRSDTGGTTDGGEIPFSSEGFRTYYYGVDIRRGE
jgi:hypothetical protein